MEKANSFEDVRKILDPIKEKILHVPFAKDVVKYSYNYSIDLKAYKKIKSKIILYRNYMIALEEGEKKEIFEININDNLLEHVAIEIANSMIYGINGRKFDIVDFFMIPSSYGIELSINKFQEIIRKYEEKFNKNDYIKISSFIYNNKDIKAKYRENSKKLILSGTIIYNKRKDENGNWLDCNIEITDEIKEKILSYMEENNISFNNKTYNCLTKRYRDGHLFNEKSYILKKCKL